MSWDYTGRRVVVQYFAKIYEGVVISSRVKYGGTVQHTVQLDETINLYGAERSVIAVSNRDVINVK